MRKEVNCSRCAANVLVVDAADDSVDLSRKIAAAGWKNGGQGPVCTDCAHKPVTTEPGPRTPEPGTRKLKAGRPKGKKR